MNFKKLIVATFVFLLIASPSLAQRTTLRSDQIEDTFTAGSVTADTIAGDTIGRKNGNDTTYFQGDGSGLFGVEPDVSGKHITPASVFSDTFSVDTGIIRDVLDMNDKKIVNINWLQSDDGSGSNLDADLLDDLNSTQFLRSDTDDSYTGDTLDLNFASLTNADTPSQDHDVSTKEYVDDQLSGVSGDTAGVEVYDSGSFIEQLSSLDFDTNLSVVQSDSKAVIESTASGGGGTGDTTIGFYNGGSFLGDVSNIRTGSNLTASLLDTDTGLLDASSGGGDVSWSQSGTEIVTSSDADFSDSFSVTDNGGTAFIDLSSSVKTDIQNASGDGYLPDDPADSFVEMNDHHIKWSTAQNPEYALDAVGDQFQLQDRQSAIDQIITIDKPDKQFIFNGQYELDGIADPNSSDDAVPRSWINNNFTGVNEDDTGFYSKNSGTGLGEAIIFNCGTNISCSLSGNELTADASTSSGSGGDTLHIGDDGVRQGTLNQGDTLNAGTDLSATCSGSSCTIDSTASGGSSGGNPITTWTVGPEYLIDGDTTIYQRFSLNASDTLAVYQAQLTANADTALAQDTTALVMELYNLSGDTTIYSLDGSDSSFKTGDPLASSGTGEDVGLRIYNNSGPDTLAAYGAEFTGHVGVRFE